MAGGGGMGGGGGGAGAGGGGMAGGGMGMGPAQPTGGTVNWAAGDDVRAIYIGQVCEGCAFGPGMMNPGGGVMGGGMGMAGANGLYAYQAYDNLVDSLPPVVSQSITDPAPINWTDPPFGPQPAPP